MKHSDAEPRTGAPDMRRTGGLGRDPIPTDPDVAEAVGEGAGGVSGLLAGAALGSFVGPVGTVVGAIAGAVGGWWAGRAVADAALQYTPTDDAFYASQYERSPRRLADRSFAQVRPAYQIGHVAARNPEYASQPFEAVEAVLRAGWSQGVDISWDQVQCFARAAYDREALADRETQRLRRDYDIDKAHEAVDPAPDTPEVLG